MFAFSWDTSVFPYIVTVINSNAQQGRQNIIDMERNVKMYLPMFFVWGRPHCKYLRKVSVCCSVKLSGGMSCCLFLTPAAPPQDRSSVFCVSLLSRVEFFKASPILSKRGEMRETFDSLQVPGVGLPSSTCLVSGYHLEMCLFSSTKESLNLSCCT